MFDKINLKLLKIESWKDKLLNYKCIIKLIVKITEKYKIIKK